MLKECRAVKAEACQGCQCANETVKDLEEGLNKILNSFSLVTAKEIAADKLGVDVEEYLVQATDEIMDEGYGEDPQEELDFNPNADIKKAINEWD